MSAGWGTVSAPPDSNVFIVDKPLFRAPKTNAEHAESMRRLVDAVGVLRDVGGEGYRLCTARF